MLAAQAVLIGLTSFYLELLNEILQRLHPAQALAEAGCPPRPQLTLRAEAQARAGDNAGGPPSKISTVCCRGMTA